MPPSFSSEEALRIEVSHIAECYFDGADQISGGRSGANVVRILEAAQRSMELGGSIQTFS